MIITGDFFLVQLYIVVSFGSIIENHLHRRVASSHKNREDEQQHRCRFLMMHWCKHTFDAFSFFPFFRWKSVTSPVDLDFVSRPIWAAALNDFLLPERRRQSRGVAEGWLSRIRAERCFHEFTRQEISSSLVSFTLHDTLTTPYYF